MFYKGIIFDLDNTIYDYDVCHNAALNATFSFITENADCQTDHVRLKSMYNEISQLNKHELQNTASSHNKSIYFKQLIEQLNMNMEYFEPINETYWNVFYENIKCNRGILEFIEWNHRKGIKIGILTDYETEYQIRKLQKLNLLSYISAIVTSEEVGVEKPSCKMFQTIIQKMNINKTDVIMIGDNYKKDICGAANMGILGLWYNVASDSDNVQRDSSHFIFNNYVKLLDHMKEHENELAKLEQTSKTVGERFDLVQAGGGNSSVKINGLMYIKASGCHMSNINEHIGYVLIDNNRLTADMRDGINNNLPSYNVIGNGRSSIETTMHAILKKYTIHLHPVQLNRILVSSNATDVIQRVYPTGKIVKYYTPGIMLCNEISKTYNGENVIFLLNHGIIITSDAFDELSCILDDVCCKFERFQRLDLSRYKFTNVISERIRDTFAINNVSYLCEDLLINDYLINKKHVFDYEVTFPDRVVYCGMGILYNIDKIQEYKQKYNEPPKIIITDNRLYINNTTLSKCRETEEVLKANLMILDSDYNKTYLPDTEVCFLNNWESEKYRRTL